MTERAGFHERLLTALRAQPEVISAGTSIRLPFAAQLDSTDSQSLVRFDIGDRPVPPDQRPFARVEVVSSGYLETLRIPILEGRSFDARDTLESAPVALVSQELARRHFQGATVVGRTLVNLRRTPVTIIGVVGDVKPASSALGRAHDLRGPRAVAALPHEAGDPKPRRSDGHPADGSARGHVDRS